MNWLDIVILAAGGFLALAGLWMGGVHAGVMVAGVLVGVALASRLHGRVEPLFAQFTDSANAAEVAGFAAVFIVVLAAAFVASFLARTILRSCMLGWSDNLVGLGLGVVVAFVIGSALLSLVQTHPVSGMEQTIDDSALGSFLADNFDVVLRGMRFFPKDLGT